jgi:hypothetical protein
VYELFLDPDPVGSGNGCLPGCHLVYGEDVLPAEEQTVADRPGQGSHQAVLQTKCRVFFCYLPKVISSVSDPDPGPDWIRVRTGSGSGLDPDSIRLVNPYPYPYPESGSVSGSRRAKMTHKR